MRHTHDSDISVRFTPPLSYSNLKLSSELRGENSKYRLKVRQLLFPTSTTGERNQARCPSVPRLVSTDMNFSETQCDKKNNTFTIMTPSNGNIFFVTGHLCAEFNTQYRAYHSKTGSWSIRSFTWNNNFYLLFYMYFTQHWSSGIPLG